MKKIDNAFKWNIGSEARLSTPGVVQFSECRQIDEMSGDDVIQPIKTVGALVTIQMRTGW